MILASFSATTFTDFFHTYPSHHIFHKIKKRQIVSRDSIKGIVLIFLLLGIWLVFSGAGGIGFQNSDYKASNALLNDLITQDWPLVANSGGIQVPVVYYVAYYLPSAVIGKAFGWVCANIFLFTWTFVGIMLAFAWFWNLSRTEFKNRAIKAGILLTGIFCLAGGLDYIGCLFGRHFFTPIAHIESWAHYFEYSSNTTLIYWVPQHTIATWLVVGMIVDALYHKHNLNYLGMVVTAGVIYSPFGILGTAPYLLLILFVYLRPQNRMFLWNWQSIVFNTLSIGVAAIYLLYLGSNQFKFPIGFIWQFSENNVDLAVHLLTFWCLEFALLGSLILLLIVLGVLFSHSTAFFRRGDHKWIVLLAQEFNITPMQLCLFLFSLSVLVILPLFKMGINNDLVMRASIPSLFIFWAFIAKVVADISLRIRMKFKLLYMLISIILTIGFFTSFNEIARSAIRYQFGPPVLSNTLTTINANETEIVLQRIGSEDSLFYRYFGK